MENKKGTSTFVLLRKYDYEINRYKKSVEVTGRRRYNPLAFFRKQQDPPLVALVYGDAGTGKHEIGQFLYDICLDANIKGVQIDWNEEYKKYPDYFHDNLNVEHYINIMYTFFRDEGYGKYFNDYEKISGLLMDAENKVFNEINKVSGVQQSPDEFRELRKFTARTVRTLVGISSLGPAYGMIPESFKETADEAISETIMAAAKGLAKARLAQKEYDVYLNGTERLVHSFAAGIKKASRKKTLAIRLNHYEIIFNSDPWLRYLISRTGSSTIWIIVGHSTELLAEEYRRDMNLGRSLIDIKMKSLTLEEIEEVINNNYSKERKATPGEIRKIYEATRGTPLALRMAMEIWQPGKNDVEVLREGDVHSKIVNAVFEKILLHRLVQANDLKHLQAIALCYKPSIDMLKYITGNEKINETISHLSKKYSYLFVTEDELIESVVYWLKEDFLERINDKEYISIASLAMEWCYTSLLEFESEYDDLAESVKREEWKIRALAAIYHCFWIENNRSKAILDDILRALLLLPQSTVMIMLSQTWKILGPLAEKNVTLQEMLSSFQRGITGVVYNRDFPTTTSKVSLDGNSIVVTNTGGEVLANIKPYSTEKSLEILHGFESGLEQNSARWRAIQIAKSRFYASQMNFKESTMLLDLIKGSIDAKKLKGTAEILRTAYAMLGREILGSSSSPKLSIKCLLSALDLSTKEEDIINVYFDLIEAYFSEGNFEKVIEVANKAILIRPETAELYNYKGIALSRLHRKDEAASIYKDGLLHGTSPFTKAIILSNLGVLYANAGRFDEAEEQYDAALNLEPNLSVTRVCKSMLTLVKNPDLALKELKNAVAVVRVLDNAFINNVLTILSKSDNATAIEILESILSNSKRSAASPYVLSAFHYEIGRRYLDERDLTKAANYIEKSIQIMPRFFPSYFLLSQIYNDLKKFDQSRNITFRGIQLMSFKMLSDFAVTNLAYIGSNMSTKQIIRQVKEVQKSQRRTAEEYIKRGAAEMISGHWDQAISYFQLAAKDGRDQFWPYFLLSVAEWGRNKLPSAIRYAENMIIKLHEGERGFAYNLLATLYEESGKISDAIDNYKKALDDYKFDQYANSVARSSILYNLGLCQYKAGNDTEAFEAFNQSYLYDPESPSGRLSHILLLLQKGDFSEARLEFRRLEDGISLDSKIDTFNQKWRSPEIAQIYKGFVTAHLIQPVFHAALFVDDKETIQSILDYLGKDAENLVDINHPIFSLSPESTSLALLRNKSENNQLPSLTAESIE
ncbi:MAG: tetratricopeptide repeat protein [Candidatus Omnitrophica bacterium]|nr:tetratricopeptide repeat protein [Candidatus Omnitrophota bacterium]